MAEGVNDISDVAMDHHHVIRDRISQTENFEGVQGAEYVPMDNEGYAGAPGLPLPQGGG